jgi:hypothetical protein
MRAVQIQEFGGPEVLELVDLPKPEPKDGEVLIEVSRAGMNFADTHQRENTYLSRFEVPLVLGGEVAGTTPDGRRVVALLASGGYAEYAVAHESTVFPIPDGVDYGAALALVVVVPVAETRLSMAFRPRTPAATITPVASAAQAKATKPRWAGRGARWAPTRARSAGMSSKRSRGYEVGMLFRVSAYVAPAITGTAPVAVNSSDGAGGPRAGRSGRHADAADASRAWDPRAGRLGSR